jgi:hypothetical protein
MYFKGCSNRDGFDAVFAGFCAVFRRGEQGWSSRDGLAGMVYKGCINRDGFDAVFAGFCESSKIK